MSYLELQRAIQDNNVDYVRDMFKTIADNIGTKIYDYLYTAVVYNRLEIIKIFFEHGIHPDSHNEYTEAPLYYATKYSYDKTIELLLDNGANINSITKKSKTALMIAIRRNRLDSAKLLLERGANINIQNNSGDTILHTIMKKSDPMKNYSNTAALVSHNYYKRVIELLLDYGADILLPNNEGHTPINLARQYWIEDIIELLSNHHAYKLTKRATW